MTLLYIFFLLSWSAVAWSHVPRSGTNATYSTATAAKSVEELKVQLGTKKILLTCPVLKKSVRDKDSLHDQHKQISYNGNAPIAPRVLDLKPFDAVVWIVESSNTLVGAGTEYNHEKYDYHPSTGQILIRNLGTTDAGVYNCLVTSGSGESGDGGTRSNRSSSSSKTELGAIRLSFTDEAPHGRGATANTLHLSTTTAGASGAAFCMRVLSTMIILLTSF